MTVVPHDRLPENVHERHDALRTYFCDKDAIAIAVEDGWKLELHWSDDADRHVDPQLDLGLAWWGTGIRRSSMAFAQRPEGRVLTCLYDTITLHSWSKWLAKRDGKVPEDLVILHVDDHRDLGAPRLLLNGKIFTDGWTGESVSLSNPNAVERAIESGAIGMGSFLTPFLHIAPHAEVRHLCQPPKANGTYDNCFALTTEVDTLLHRGMDRPAIQLDPQSGRTGPGTYRVTNRVDDWARGIGSGPILLHIDMDYFNNRYDGDSQWQDRVNVLDPPLTDVLAKIGELGSAVRSVSKQIEDCVVAYSPGFFPAEFWSAADARLHAVMSDLYAY